MNQYSDNKKSRFKALEKRTSESLVLDKTHKTRVHGEERTFNSYAHNESQNMEHECSNPDTEIVDTNVSALSPT